MVIPIYSVKKMRRVNDTYFERFILSVKVKALFWTFEGTVCKYNLSLRLYRNRIILLLVDTSKFEEFSESVPI